MATTANQHVYITHEAYRALKIQAASEGRSMKFLLSMLIVDYVAANKEGRQHP